jgi:hypothetical protein
MSFDPDSDSSFSATPAARNYVKFYKEWIRNNFQSKAQGTEVGEYRDFVLIISPGMSKSETRRQVQDRDIKEYGAEWVAYLEGKEQLQNGIPIERLPNVAQGMLALCKSHYILTIEALAGLSDLGKQKLGMGSNDLVRQAQQYLAGTSKESIAAKQRAAELEGQVAEMLRVNAELQARIEALESVKPRRGRPPKRVDPPGAVQ